jgi:hypothetical protein
MTVEFSLSAKTTAFASVVLRGWDGRKWLEERNIMICGGRGQRQFYIDSGTIDLWYPVGYGKQPIYIVDVQITSQVTISTLSCGMNVANSPCRKEISWTPKHRKFHSDVHVLCKRN